MVIINKPSVQRQWVNKLFLSDTLLVEDWWKTSSLRRFWCWFRMNWTVGESKETSKFNNFVGTSAPGVRTNFSNHVSLLLYYCKRENVPNGFKYWMSHRFCLDFIQLKSSAAFFEYLLVYLFWDLISETLRHQIMKTLRAVEKWFNWSWISKNNTCPICSSLFLISILAGHSYKMKNKKSRKYSSVQCQNTPIPVKTLHETLYYVT